MRALLTTLAFAGLFLGWNAPNHYPPWPTFHLELFAAIGLCALAAGVAIFPAPPSPSASVPLPLGWPARLWLVASCVPLLQHAMGLVAFRGDAVLGFLYGASVVLGLYCGQLWALQHGRAVVLKLLHGCVVIGAVAACGLGLVHWLRLSPPGWWAMELIDDRPFANLAQPNHFGLLMVWGIVGVTALYELRVVERRGVWALAVAFLGAGVLMSQSRASSLALVVVAVLWFVTRKRALTRLRVGEIWLAIGAGVAMAMAVEPLQHALVLAGPELRATGEVGPREAIWKHFLAAIHHSPWLGYGFNQGVAAMANVAAHVEPSRNVTFAHNVVLDFVTWFGVPFAACAVVGLAIWLLGWLRRTEDLALHSQRHLVLALWCALLVQSLLEFPFAHSYFLIPAALLAGAVAGLPGAGVPLPASPHWRYGATASLLVLACAALLALTTWDYLRLEAEFRQLRFDRAAFGGTGPRASPSPPMLLDQLAALNASAQRVPSADMTEAELGAMHRLARRFHIPSVRLDYAKALALNGRPAEAELELAIIRSVNPPAKWAAIQHDWQQWLQAARISDPQER